jgi:RNA polymerase sigma-70 factor (ECF subfamily)
VTDLAALYDRAGPRLYRHALAWTRCAATAEDAVQAAFAGLLARGGKDDIEAVERYLHVAVRRRARDLARRAQRHGELPDSPLVAPDPADPGAAEEVDQALRSLPPEQREVVLLHVFDGLTFARIGSLCGISPNTAASRYRYARQRLEEWFRVRS